MSEARRVPEVDVCVVGLGAVGSLAAYAISEGGREVLALEAGPERNGREVVMDELRSATLRNAWGEPKFNGEMPTWRLNADSPRRPTTSHARMANGVGGSSLSYAGTSLRFHPDDFQVRTNTLARYGPSALPPGSIVTDWPITYDELEPYYDETERLIGISGQAGNLRGTIVPGGNPFEGNRQNPYPIPPLRPSGQGEMFAAACRELGYHPFPVPTAILSEAYDGRQACTYCSYCTRMGCHVGAKGTTAITVVPRALATGNLTIRTDSRVTRLVADVDRRIVGVEYAGPEGRVFQPARVVVLAAYSFENVRLMLLSANKNSPDGIGNEHGQVGRGYLTHQSRAVFGLFESRRLHRFIGPYSQGSTIDDFNADHFDHTDLGFIRGGRMAMINQSTPILDSRLLPPNVPRWGRAYKEFLAKNLDSMGYISVSPEVLPYEMNFLDLDPEVRDAHGDPVIRITFDTYENERRMTDYLLERARELMHAMGATSVWRRQMEPVAISTHDAGGTRMGTDPTSSVVDSYGEVHTAPGLFVLGGSTFPTHSGMNSTLTMQALALRTGRFIAGQR